MESWNEIKAWRKARREELVTARAAFAAGERDAWGKRITALLETGFALPPGAVIGFCWPYKSEFDARFAVRHWRERGAIAALPEVVEKAHPLQFRKWWPGAPMKPGVHDIPVPDGTEVVLWSLEDGGHTWPGGNLVPAEERLEVGNVNRDISASEEIWKFFQRHRLN